jgi:hypothetical protein
MSELEKWQTREMLILGSTYPNHSKKYKEISCTGAFLKESREIVRLHPIPRRYLEKDQGFRAFQWITAKIMKHDSDPRPESYRVKHDSITLGTAISPREYEYKRSFFERSPHLLASVEELKERQKTAGTSLGIIQPKSITKVRIEKRPQSERVAWDEAEKKNLEQEVLAFDAKPKPIDFPEVRFMVSWKCDDSRCKGHEMALLDWGINELYRKLEGDSEREKKVIAKMEVLLDQERKDIFLVLGNFRGVLYNFGLMGSFCPPKVAQKLLF